jgi:hypothetical protein
VEVRGANQVRTLIGQCTEFSNNGEIGKALTVLDDFLAESVHASANGSLEPEAGLPLFWMRRWRTPEGLGSAPSYTSHVFLLLLLRCIVSDGPRWITSPVFGVEEWWNATRQNVDQAEMTAEFPFPVNQTGDTVQDSGTSSAD